MSWQPAFSVHGSVGLGGMARRAVSWLAIALLHGGAFYALSTGMSVRESTIESTPIEAVLLTEREPAPPAPVITEPALVSLALDVRPPDIELTMPAEAPASTAITLPPPPPPAQPVQAAARTQEPKLISEVAYVRPPQPRYPPESRKAREEGLVVLRVLIDERGRAMRIDVETSSGYPRLDAAARAAVANALFTPYVEDGVARKALVMIPIEFGLRHRYAAANH